MKGFRFLARVTLALFGAASLASAQPGGAPPGQPSQAQQQRITPNFKDADITQIAEAVSAATASAICVMSASLKLGVMRCCWAGGGAGWPACGAPAGCADASEAALRSASVPRAKKQKPFT